LKNLFEFLDSSSSDECCYIKVIVCTVTVDFFFYGVIKGSNPEVIRGRCGILITFDFTTWQMWDLYQRELINEKVDIWVIIIWSTTYPLPCIDEFSVCKLVFKYAKVLTCFITVVMMQALGCLLYRIAYLKLAFDGESKLQILNGNYRIPDAPRYSSAITDLIRDMLIASPEARPDIMQARALLNRPLICLI
jgi:hypothetical protein